MIVPPEVFGLSACCADSHLGKYSTVVGVQLSRSDSTLRAAATDARVFVVTKWPERGKRRRKNCKLVIPREAWKAATKRKQWKRVPLPSLYVDERKRTTIGLEDQEERLKVTPLDGPYPSWKAYIPAYKPSESVSIVLDAAVLGKLLKALIPLSTDVGGHHPVKLTISIRPQDAVRIFCKSGETKTEAAIMPMDPRLLLMEEE